MALTQRHRSAIYDVWAPQLGEEVAEALISHFPARDLDEPVTKEFVEVKVAELRADIAEFRAEQHQTNASLRAEMREGDAALRDEMREGHAALRDEMHEGHAALRDEMREGDAALRAEIGALRDEMREGDASLRDEVRQEFEEFRKYFDARLQQMVLWMAGVIVALASIAVSIAIAVG